MQYKAVVRMCYYVRILFEYRVRFANSFDRLKNKGVAISPAKLKKWMKIRGVIHL